MGEVSSAEEKSGGMSCTDENDDASQTRSRPESCSDFLSYHAAKFNTVGFYFRLVATIAITKFFPM